MVFLKAVLLAVVEGVTEFLPISSTGHLILFDEWVSLSADRDFSNAFMVMIQLPAILSVVVYFWKDLWPFSGDRRAVRGKLILWTKIAAACVPAAVLGLLFDDAIEAYLLRPLPVAVALLVGGVILIFVERGKRTHRFETIADITFPLAVFIGMFQCLAMIPGTSRSAATIIGAMVLGASRVAAAEFSFFLAIPTMLGATLLTTAKHGLGFTPQQWAVLAVGSAVSFAVAYGVIAGLMTYIRRHDFRVFGYYRIALGLLVIAYFCCLR